MSYELLTLRITLGIVFLEALDTWRLHFNKHPSTTLLTTKSVFLFVFVLQLVIQNFELYYKLRKVST